MSARRKLLLAVGVYASCALAAAPLWALQRTLKSKAHSYPNAPVEVRRSQVSLVETFTSPTQFMTSDAKAKTTRVRYANRAGLAPSVFVLSGDITCANTSSKPVEALSLTVVPLDAFHQPINTPGLQQGFTMQHALGSLPRGGTKRITWEQSVNSSDVYEVAVIITRVRFADGKVWSAPTEELLDAF
jgi:hypothetical protein